MVQMVEYESKLQTGQPAPDFSLPDITGIQHSLGGFHGRVVILNFWSAECTWAQRTDAALQQLLQAWRERVVLISVASNTNEDPGLIRQTAGDRGGRFLCAGIATVIFFQVVINTGMMIGLFPITGIPLPLMSQGGSAALGTFLALGLAMSVNMRRFVN